MDGRSAGRIVQKIRFDGKHAEPSPGFRNGSTARMRGPRFATVEVRLIADGTAAMPKAEGSLVLFAIS
jgi:hypothetical protein